MRLRDSKRIIIIINISKTGMLTKMAFGEGSPHDYLSLESIFSDSSLYQNDHDFTLIPFHS